DLAAAIDSVVAAQATLGGYLHPRYSDQFQLPLLQLRAELCLADGRPADAITLVASALDELDVSDGARYVWPLLVARACACAAAAQRAAAPRARAVGEQAADLLARLSELSGQMNAAGPAQQAAKLVFTAATVPGGTAGRGAFAAWDEAASSWDKLKQPYQLA